jgi:hypothetical protein
VPYWLPDLAEAIAGLRYNQDRIEEPVSDTLFFELKADLEKSRATDPLTLWAQKFVNAGAAAPTLTGSKSARQP